MLVRLAGGRAVADLIERKLYLKAKWARKLPEIETLLDRSKLENFVTAATTATSTTPTTPARSTAAPRSASRRRRTGRVVLDPYWLGGARRHVRRTAPRALRAAGRRTRCCRSSASSRPREAARLLAVGLAAGRARADAPVPQPAPRRARRARADLLRSQHERLLRRHPRGDAQHAPLARPRRSPSDSSSWPGKGRAGGHPVAENRLRRCRSRWHSSKRKLLRHHHPGTIVGIAGGVVDHRGVRPDPAAAW